jgi:hypothetical protein
MLILRLSMVMIRSHWCKKASPDSHVHIHNVYTRLHTHTRLLQVAFVTACICTSRQCVSRFRKCAQTRCQFLRVVQYTLYVSMLFMYGALCSMVHYILEYAYLPAYLCIFSRPYMSVCHEFVCVICVFINRKSPKRLFHMHIVHVHAYCACACILCIFSFHIIFMCMCACMSVCLVLVHVQCIYIYIYIYIYVACTFISMLLCMYVHVFTLLYLLMCFIPILINLYMYMHILIYVHMYMRRIQL